MALGWLLLYIAAYFLQTESQLRLHSPSRVTRCCSYLTHFIPSFPSWMNGGDSPRCDPHVTSTGAVIAVPQHPASQHPHPLLKHRSLPLPPTHTIHAPSLPSQVLAQNDEPPQNPICKAFLPIAIYPPIPHPGASW